jgi:hypothetical protein
MFHSASYQLYRYEHGLTAAEQRAADARAGKAAAGLRDLRISLGRTLRLRRRVRPGGQAAGAVTASGTAAAARVLSSAR